MSFYDNFALNKQPWRYSDEYLDDVCDDHIEAYFDEAGYVSNLVSKIFRRTTKNLIIQEKIDDLLHNTMDVEIIPDGVFETIVVEEDEDSEIFMRFLLSDYDWSGLESFKDNWDWLIRKWILTKRKKVANGDTFNRWLKVKRSQTTIGGVVTCRSFASVAKKYNISWYKNIQKKKKTYKTNKKTNTRTAKEVLRTKYAGVQFHSGGNAKVSTEDRASKRNQRDIKQRKCAKDRVKDEYKQKPKDERKREVLMARDKRTVISPDFQMGLPSGLVGVVTKLALGMSGYIAANAFRRGADKITDEVSSVLTEIKKLANRLRKSLGSAIWRVPFIMVVWYVLRRNGVNNRLLDLGLGACMTMLVGRELWNHVFKYFQEEDDDSTAGEIEFQSGSATKMAELLTVIVTFSALGKGFNPRHVTEFVKRIGLFEKTKGGFEGFVEWVFKSTETIVNLVRSWFGKDRVNLFRKHQSATEKWLSEVDELVFNHNTASITIDADEINRIIAMMRKYVELKELYRNTPMSRSIEEAGIKLNNVLMPHLGAINSRNNFRQEPVVVCMHGKPGIGKTLMAMPFCATVLILSGLVKSNDFDSLASEMWQKGVSEFWNSYANQIGVIMDDAFQQRVDKTNPDNDFMNLIRMVSTWAFPLNMADLASKGKIFFGSKFILANTNLSSIHAEANSVIHEPEAVARRITFGCTVKVVPEYALPDGKLNPDCFAVELEKCKGLKGVDAFPWHIWSVCKHDFMSGQDIGTSYPLVQMIHEVVTRLRAKNMSFKQSKTILESYMSGLTVCEQMGDDEETAEQTYARLKEEAEKEAFSKLTEDTMKKATGKAYLGTHKLYKEGYFESRSFPTRILDKFKLAFVGFMVCVDQAAKFFKHAWQINGFERELIIEWCTIFAGALAVWVAYFWSTRRKAVQIEPIDWQSNRPAKPPVSDRANFPTFQGGDISVQKNVYANSYKLFWRDGNDLNIAGQVLFVDSTLALMPAHFSRRFREKIEKGTMTDNTLLTFQHVSQPQHTFTMKVKTFFNYKRFTLADHDVEFVDIADCRAHRSLFRNFLTEHDIRYLDGSGAIMTLCDIADNGIALMTPRERFWSIPVVNFVRDLNISGIKILRTMTYSAPTQPGDCGAPLCLMDSNHFSGRTCFGLHIAGDGAVNRGFSSIVTQEMIAKAKKELGTITDNFETDIATRGVAFQISDEEPFENMGSFLPIGVVDKPNNLARRSKLFPFADVFDAFGPSKDRPAPLSPVWRDDVLIYPMVNAVQPYSSPLFIVEDEIMDLAVHVAMKKFSHLSNGLPRIIYTFEEACLGVSQHKMRSLPRGTSAGYPYTQEVTNGKKMFFGDGDEFDFTSDLCVTLKTRVEHIITSAAHGERLCHVFADFLKDELRSPEKVAAVKTRLISSAPIDYTIAFRMYFGAFSSAMMRTHTNSGMAPGICTFTEWYVAATFLKQKGDKIFDGDFKAFDASEQPGLMVKLLDYINEWYGDGDENAMIRRVLWEDLCHSRHIGGNGLDQRFIYQWNKSLPSGHPFTTCINSMYSLTVLVAAYMKLTKDWTGFWDKAHALTYGDDNVVNVSDSVADIYNQVTVAGAIEELFGMVYTPGRKDGVWKPYSKIEEITFLKRSFVLEDNTWLCPLELESALFCAYWGRNKRDKVKNMFDNLEFTLRELAHHSEEVWDKYVPLIRDIYVRYGKQSAAPLRRCVYRFLTLNEPDRYY